MVTYTTGDRVVCTCDIGGFVRPTIPKGSCGVITHAGLFGDDLHALFAIDSILGNHHIETRVNDTDLE